jgi:threonyl-tRNA synthetase
MNCPGHCLLFKSQNHSYRDMPVRYADFSPLHRNEVSGSLTGLTRVRRFHQDDGHIFCRPQQIKSEIASALGFVEMAMKTFGLGPYRLVLSTRPETDYIGTLEMWDNAETQLREALDSTGREWALNEGDGAFYGPKIDIQLQDQAGKYHQLSTIQLDMNLPQRFELEYQVAEGEPDYNPATPAVVQQAKEAAAKFSGFRALLNDGSAETPRPLSSVDSTFLVDVDTSAQTLGKKIQRAKQMKYNLIFILGSRDLADGGITVDVTGQMRSKTDKDALQLQALIESKLGENALQNPRAVKLKVDEVHPLLVDLEKNFV